MTPNTLRGLEEHHRDSEPFLTNLQQFHEAIDRFFANPGKLTYGTESADQGVERFDAAVESAIDDSDARNIMIVCHGTVISLFLSRQTGISPMDIWRRLNLPSFAAMNLPERDLLDIVTDIT